MINEKQTDLIIASKLQEAGIVAEPNGSSIREISNALRSASKRGTGRIGFPEYIAKVGKYIIVVEDKADQSKQVKYIDEKKNVLLMDNSSITNYAENGAVHYAKYIITNTSFKYVFAFGCSGTNPERMTIRPIFVSPSGYRLLKQQKDFSCFNENEIDAFYEKEVLNQKSKEQAELEAILSNAKDLHESLHMYGSLGNLEKPVVVSAILLALQNVDFDTEQLSCDPEFSDGQKIFNALSEYMDTVHVEPGQKKEQVLDQFRFIQTRPNLSAYNEKLGKSPLRYFAEYLYSNVLTAFNYNNPEDVLGRFYGEFMSYSGGDGQSLGIILTPKHITQLACDLLEVTPNDNVFDPCCGTGGFLIAAMSKMMDSAVNNGQRLKIKKEKLHGIEMNEGMFSIATTNMILRGDGKSNLMCNDFFKFNSEDLRQKHFSVGLMNPPYSVASHTELEFISHLLDSLDEGARCFVIVPQSTMVGKTKKEQIEKEYILRKHTLKGVITFNSQTFFGVGTHTVGAIFEAHKPHPKNYYAKFINFKDDGYVVAPHIGLIPTKDVAKRRKLLLDCFLNNKPAKTDFMVCSTVEPDDEWLHSFYYFNEEIPSDAEFEKTMADYLSFEFSMIVHGKGFLFNNGKTNE